MYYFINFNWWCLKYIACLKVHVFQWFWPWSRVVVFYVQWFVCRGAHFLFTVFVFVCVLWCPTYILCCVFALFFFVLCPVLPVSLGGPFLIAPSVFSNLSPQIFKNKKDHDLRRWKLRSWLGTGTRMPRRPHLAAKYMFLSIWYIGHSMVKYQFVKALSSATYSLQTNWIMSNVSINKPG